LTQLAAPGQRIAGRWSALLYRTRRLRHCRPAGPVPDWETRRFVV